MDELLEQFLIETRDLVAAASADLDLLVRDPRDRAVLDSTFRAIHTLKGSFGVFALTPAEQVLHAAEDVLEQARKGAMALDADARSALLACLDQTDRWIDEMERSGALDAGAQHAADRICARLSPTAGDVDPTPPPPRSASGDWVDRLTRRGTPVAAEAEVPLTAFRYAPDPDCFFRGDDPLAVIASVPELLSLTVSPSNGSWPSIDELEPFVCFSVLEGLSAAPLEAVRAAFRLVPDQVALAPVVPPDTDQTERTDADPRERRTMRVDAARVGELADGLGELLVAVHGVSRLVEEADRVAPGIASRIRAAHTELERVSGKLYGSLREVRTVPLEASLRRLPRMAREIAKSIGKDISLVVSGQNTEVDRHIADGLYEPLLHLLRNAIDHGIEPAKQREAAGKPAHGSIALTFRRDGEMIEALLEDDGGGIDPDRIRRFAVDRGLTDDAGAAAMNDRAALRLIFSPGFSTAGTVTELSGRGVGMNAVQTALAALRGTIGVESTLGEGTRFRMRIPANALITRLLVVAAGGDQYGVSLDQIVETIRTTEDRLLPVGSGQAFVLRNRTLPVLSLAALLGQQDQPEESAKLLVTHAGGEPVALRVTGFGERIDTQLRAPSGLLAAVPGVMGSALLSDGGVLLVLDLAELAA